MRKCIEKFNPYSPTVQVCLGLITTIFICATKVSTCDETLFDVIRLQARLVGTTFMLYFVQYILEKYVDKKDVEAHAIYGITLTFWLVITLAGLMYNFPLIENVIAIFMLPAVMLFDMKKFKFKWYIVTLAACTLFMVAWQ